MQKMYPENKFPQLRFHIGDIRDYDRLLLATREIDLIVHAAALKQVVAAEYNPIEFIKTNILHKIKCLYFSIVSYYVFIEIYQLFSFKNNSKILLLIMNY